VLPGTFTTAARNAIPAGSRPKGTSVFNSDLNMWEFNSGTDGSPSWTTIGAAASTSGALSAIPAANAVLAGSFFYATDMDVLYRSNGSAWSRVNSVAGDIFMTLNASAAPGRILLQGQAWTSTSGIYADLYAKWGGATLPDMRGRIPVNIGTNGDINALRMDDGLAVGPEVTEAQFHEVGHGDKERNSYTQRQCHPCRCSHPYRWSCNFSTAGFRCFGSAYVRSNATAEFRGHSAAGPLPTRDTLTQFRTKYVRASAAAALKPLTPAAITQLQRVRAI
jgi:hypothetical protein